MTIIDKSSAFGSRFNMYRLPGAGYAYNPDLKEWEVFHMDNDGSIQDLKGRYQTKQDAIEAAQIESFLKSEGLEKWTCSDCSGEQYFSHSNDAGTLAGDVLRYTFILV